MSEPCPDPPTPLTLLRRLHKGYRSDAAIAAELSLAFSPRTWNRHQVRRLRQKLGLKAINHSRGRLLQLHRRDSWRRAQWKAGLGHLLPEERPEGGWTRGVELTPVQLRVMLILRDGCLLTAGQLARKLGLAGGRMSVWSFTRRVLCHLLRLDLVTRQRRRGERVVVWGCKALLSLRG